ncbi:hypothetical protein FQN50_003810 [Emmonsiellopsis sp. PD_5]|nr:hypothetical protein FQN50_003810 [Emmonsiellopsis sp. PD_5]
MAQVATGTNRVPISANPNMFETLDQAGSAQSHGGSSYNPGAQGKPAPTKATNQEEPIHEKILAGIELMQTGMEQLQHHLGSTDKDVQLIEQGLGKFSLNILKELLQKKQQVNPPAYQAPAGPANTPSYAGALHSELPPKPATAKELQKIKIHSKTLSDLLLQNSATEVLTRVNKATREKGIRSILGAHRLTGQEVIMVAKDAATKARAERNTAWLTDLRGKESKIHSK